MLSFLHSKGRRRLLQAWFVLFLLPYFGNDNFIHRRKVVSDNGTAEETGFI